MERFKRAGLCLLEFIRVGVDLIEIQDVDDKDISFHGKFLKLELIQGELRLY